MDFYPTVSDHVKTYKFGHVADVAFVAEHRMGAEHGRTDRSRGSCAHRSHIGTGRAETVDLTASSTGNLDASRWLGCDVRGTHAGGSHEPAFLRPWLGSADPLRSVVGSVSACG